MPYLLALYICFFYCLLEFVKNYQIPYKVALDRLSYVVIGPPIWCLLRPPLSLFLFCSSSVGLSSQYYTVPVDTLPGAAYEAVEVYLRAI